MPSRVPKPLNPLRALAATAAIALLAGGSMLASPGAAYAATPHSLMVTEIVPDNTGNDHFEYFEVHNPGTSAIDLDAVGIEFAYIYSDLDARGNDVALEIPAGTFIFAGETVVFWVSYTTGNVDSSAYTEDDFRSHFAATQPDTNYRVIRATGQPGMANGGSRGISISESNEEISRSYYPGGTVSAGRGIDFRLPVSGLSLDQLATLSEPSPGIIDPAALTVADVDVPEIAPRDLLITEFAPDNTGADAYEFVEIVNTTNRDIDLAAEGVTVVYDYISGTKPLPYGAGADTVVPANSVAVLWLNYSPNTDNLTADNFRSFYGTGDDYVIIPITGQSGFANSVERGISLQAGGSVITSARYLASQIAGGLGVDYRLPARGDSVEMAVLQALAAPSPGVVDAQAYVPEAFNPQPDPELVTAPLQITEVAPDTANISGADAYEFIEVYNSTSEAIDFSDYTLEYLYPLADLTNSSTALWPATNRNAIIPAGGTIVFWIKNGANDALTSADFNTHFGSTLTADVDLFEIEAGGMANSAARGLQIVTNTGHILNRAYYFLGGVDDTVADQPIQYAVNHEDLSLQRKLGIGSPTPGKVLPEQVENGLMILPIDTVEPVIEDHTASEIAAGADFALSFTATDDIQVKTVTLRLRSNLDADFTSSQLIGPSGEFGAVINAVDLIGKRWFEYELIASDGTQQATTGLKRINVAGVSADPLRLNVSEGQWLRGAVTLAAGADTYPNTAELQIDGSPATSTTPQLESAPVFAFEATGVDTFFRNGVKVGEGDSREVLHIFDDGIYSGWETISTEVPLSYIVAGDTVTVSVWAGTKAAPEIDLNENNDDFSIRNLRLILPDGRTLAPAGYTEPGRVLAMGDSVGKLDYYDAVFTIPADAATAVSTVWDTTAAADGDHIVTAIDGDTQVAVTVHVDNTAPQIDTELEEARLYQGEFVIDASAIDGGSGLASLTATLDGAAIQLPFATSSIKLADGEHAAVFTATDIAGNVETRTVNFSTPVEEPGVELITPEDGAEFTDADTIELKARASDPTDDTLEVEINRGYRLVPGIGIAAFTGQTNIAATADRSTARALTTEEVAAIARLDEQTIAETSDTAFPYQLFEVSIPEDAGDDARLRVRWDGSANANAKVLMSVLTVDGTWEEVARVVTEAESGALTLEATVPVAQHDIEGVATVLVQHSEGFAGQNLTTRDSDVVNYHADATPRAEYDFTLAWESDTQYYNEEFHQHQTAIHDFLLAERENLNLQYLFHTGDIIDDYDQFVQWEAASPEYVRLDDAGLPYGVLAGNHDVGHKEVDYTNYSAYFGADRYSSNPWWGGDYADNRGHYDLFSAGGIDFIVVSMGWDPGDAEIAWMNEVLAQYPERAAIINLHEYMLTTGGLGPIPQRIQNEVVATNANVKLVMSGHYHDAYTRIDGFDDDGDGIAERHVYQMLFDYQGLPEGGLGYLRLLHFDNATGEIVIRTYSPSLDDFDSDDPSLEMEHQEFTIPYSALGIQSQTKQLSTDAFAVDVLTEDHIQVFSEVESGSEVSADWAPGLGEHGWYASSTDPYAASADSEVRLVSVVAAGDGGDDGGDGDGGDGDGGDGEGGDGETGGAPSEPSVPVPTDQLDPAQEGLITAPGSVRIGDPFVVNVGSQYAGQWVQLWLHSDPVALGGWARVATDGTVTAIIPAGTMLGAHTLVAQTQAGVIGWTGITVNAAAGQLPDTSTGGTDLASTGLDTGTASVISAGLISVGMLAVVLGGVMLMRRRDA